MEVGGGFQILLINYTETSGGFFFPELGIRWENSGKPNCAFLTETSAVPTTGRPNPESEFSQVNGLVKLKKSTIFQRSITESRSLYNLSSTVSRIQSKITRHMKK